jgi:hypothetical protein
VPWLGGIGGNGIGPSRRVRVESGKVAENSSAPAITNFANAVFILKYLLRSLVRVKRVQAINNKTLGFTGNFQIWNRFFPKWELRGGAISC